MRNNFTKGARKKRTGGRRGRKRQTGKGIFSSLKKIARNPILRDIARTGAKYLPGLYRGGVSKIKNKNLKKVLGSDLATGFVDNLSSRVFKKEKRKKKRSRLTNKIRRV